MLACYEQIYNDLNQAITYYQASGIARKEDENHKINVNAAYATYARAALTREDWSTAAHYAALARAGYPLMNADEYFDGFSTVNREWIWSIYDSEEESLGNSSLAARLAGYGSVLGGLVGIFIIVMLPIGILTSYVLWKKGKIQVVDKEQK